MNAPAEQLVLPLPRTYTRTDYAALRAYVQGVSPGAIAERYYDPESKPGASADALERHLRTMRDDLVHLAQLHGSSVLADHLKTSIRQHGSAKLTAVTLKMVEDASKLAVARPLATHPVGGWFRPMIARRLTGEGVATLGDLIALCNRRGGSWWRSVPRIGLLRARILVAWLRQHVESLGMTVDADVDADEPFAAPVDQHVMLAPAGGEDRPAGALAPLERIALPHMLSGAHGVNRAGGLCYLQASHDLDAIRAYLHRYSDRPQALRAYTRELERLLLWAVTERGTALSSLTVEDCNAYKAFLAAPTDRFVGPRQSRQSPLWRPFAPGGLTPTSQKYAVLVIRGAFDWLVQVRYLAGNPWAAVSDPATITPEHAIQIERALPLALWTQVRQGLAEQTQRFGPDAARWRAAAAAIFLMGDSGLRITEATLAQRERLRYVQADGDVPAGWSLQIVGKGRKQRSVPVSAACVTALRAHWADRELDFDAPPETAPLIKPTEIPPTPAAQRRHGDELGAAGYSANGLRGLVNWAFAQLREQLELTDDERQHLASATPHALRHTFGTQAIAANVPPDVAQKVLGHASLATTSIYAQAENKRVRRELAGYFAQMQALDTPTAPIPPVPATVITSAPDTSTGIESLSDANQQLAHVRVALQVRASTDRRAERARDALERWLLGFVDVTAVEPGVVLLAIRYDTPQALDWQVERRLDDIADQAEDDDVACALDARWGDRRWVHSGEHDARARLVAADTLGKPGAIVTRAPGTSGPRIWRLRVSLLGFKPEIWRRIEILADIDLAELHTIVQAVMGWGDMHRYGFGLYGFLDRIDLDCDRARGVRLLDVAQPGDTLGYTYDISDDWHHAINIEAEIQPVAKTRYPRCTAGRNACPPEDCGGPSGYAHLLRTLAGRMTGEKRELLDWLGSRFDPHAFRVADVNQRLADRHSEWE
uniref:IS1096 element passenger TnpR family protein n=1 Tax=Burkholderia arboris TaxID=488730 RepID=UPI003BEEFE06